MVGFNVYLKDYLEFNNISQTEFAMKIGISKNYMNNLLNGKRNITEGIATDIEKVSGIRAEFILKIEYSKRIIDKLKKKYKDEKSLKQLIHKKYNINELKKNKDISFKDERNIYQVSIDLMRFFKIKDL